MQLAPLRASGSAGVATLAIVIVLAGCGSSSSTKTKAALANSQPAVPPTTLALSISEARKTSKYAGAASVNGGLVTVRLTNNGKAPHGAQLIRILGNHTIPQALMAVGGPSGKSPNWLHAEGGVGFAPPGRAVDATVDLPAGNYAVADVAGAQAGQGGPPAFAPLTVTPGRPGALPATATTVTAAAPSKDHYKWEISGPLKVGANTVTFVSKGKQTLHELTAVRVTGNPSNAQIVRDLGSNGPPPSYVDQESAAQTAVLDSGKALTTQLTLAKPGTYVLFCHLKDRDGGKPHFAEGLLTKVTVK
jgi:hypothetical protein